MKKIFIVILVTAIATASCLYFRPSYSLIGQLDWVNVLTKGYFLGTVPGFFSQGFIDESFWYVMRYTMGGLIAGMMLMMFMGGSKSSGKSKKK
jgi:hypothetical protein